VISKTGSLECLAADRKAGHGSSFDLVIVDETGLFPERARELLAGLRSAISAKNGRIVHISVRGDSPLYREVLANPQTKTSIYAADPLNGHQAGARSQCLLGVCGAVVDNSHRPV